MGLVRMCAENMGRGTLSVVVVYLYRALLHIAQSALTFIITLKLNIVLPDFLKTKIIMEKLAINLLFLPTLAALFLLHVFIDNR